MVCRYLDFLSGQIATIFSRNRRTKDVRMKARNKRKKAKQNATDSSRGGPIQYLEVGGEWRYGTHVCMHVIRSERYICIYICIYLYVYI